MITKIQFWASSVIEFLMNIKMKVSSVGLLAISFVVMHRKVYSFGWVTVLEGVILCPIIEYLMVIKKKVGSFTH